MITKEDEEFIVSCLRNEGWIEIDFESMTGIPKGDTNRHYIPIESRYEICNVCKYNRVNKSLKCEKCGSDDTTVLQFRFVQRED